jgi:predicted DNA-binding antitoxin AbrB/MazE fold protein
MDQSVPAIFDGTVFRPLAPVELAQGTPVTVQFAASTAPSADDAAARLAWQAYIERMESLPDESASDGFSNRDHDRLLYGK